MPESNLFLLEKRIFIVEDDVLNLHVVSKPLSLCGAMIYFNYNSIGIPIHIVQSLPIDIILMDIMLKRGISGYDIFTELQQNPQTVGIPVVAVTSLDPETEIPKAKAMGFAGFISKPIQINGFAQIIADIIDGKKRWVSSQ